MRAGLLLVFVFILILLTAPPYVCAEPQAGINPRGVVETAEISGIDENEISDDIHEFLAVAGPFLRAKPAEHTILLTDMSAVAINSVMDKALPYKPAQLAGATMLAYSPHLLCTHPSIPANNVNEMAELSKKKPAGPAQRWMRLAEAAEAAAPTPVRRLIRRLS